MIDLFAFFYAQKQKLIIFCCNFFFHHRISQYDYKNYLKGIQANSDLLTGTLEEMASELQRKFEALVAEDKDIYEKACKGTY